MPAASTGAGASGAMPARCASSIRPCTGLRLGDQVGG